MISISKNTMKISKSIIEISKSGRLGKIIVRSPFCALKGFFNFSLSSVLFFNYCFSIYINKRFYKKPINTLLEGKRVAMLRSSDNVVPFLEVVTMGSLMLFLPQNLYLASFLKSPFGCIILMSAICFFLRIFGLRDCCVDTVVDQEKPYIDDDFLLLSSWKEKKKLILSLCGDKKSCCAKSSNADDLEKYTVKEKSLLNRLFTLKDLENLKCTNFEEFKSRVETLKANDHSDSSHNGVCCLSSRFLLFPMNFFFSSLQLSSSLALCLINILELPVILFHNLMFDRQDISLLETSATDIRDLSKDCIKSFVSVISLGMLSLRITPLSQLSQATMKKFPHQCLNSSSKT